MHPTDSSTSKSWTELRKLDDLKKTDYTPKCRCSIIHPCRPIHPVPRPARPARPAPPARPPPAAVRLQ